MTGHFNSILIHIIGCIDGHLTLILTFLFLQVDSSGNCLFGALKRSLTVRNNTSAGRDALHFPNCYFWRQVINYMINHRCLINHNKYEALMSLYGVEEMDPSRDWNLLLSFKQYLRCLLKRSFWGDKVILYAVSCMWRLKITILNTKTLQEYRIHHDRVLDHADAVLTFSNNHFNAAGTWFLAGSWASIICKMWSSYWSHCSCTYVFSSHLAGHFSHFSDC